MSNVILKTNFAKNCICLLLVGSLHLAAKSVLRLEERFSASQ